MKHDLVQDFDINGESVLICRTCLLTFAATTPRAVVEASECSGGFPDIPERFATKFPTVDQIAQMFGIPLFMTNPRPAPYEDCDTKGTRLIEKWIEEMGQ